MGQSGECPADIILRPRIGLHADQGGYGGLGPRVAEGRGRGAANVAACAERNRLEGLHGVISAYAPYSKRGKDAQPVVKDAAVAGEETCEEEARAAWRLRPVSRRSGRGDSDRGSFRITR